MFIIKTINESTDIDLGQFDLVDSICESYEDLLVANETLARFDIQEQELIHTESADLEAFREDAMARAKEMLEKFIAKFKIRYQAFVTWLNKQIIRLFKNKLEKYLSKNKDKLNKAIKWFKDTNNSPAGKSNPISKYLHKAVVKNNKVVSLKEFIDKASDVLYDITYNGELDMLKLNLDLENTPNIDIIKLYKDRVEKEVGTFETITSGDKAFIFPVDAFNDFDYAIELIGKVAGKDGFFSKTENNLKRMMDASDFSNKTFKIFSWRYIQFTKMVNTYLSMCRRYFMTCLLSASSIVNAYENAQK